MPMNAFASQKEVIFVMYDDIIRTTKFPILQKLLTEAYRKNYKYSIDYSKPDNKTDNELMSLIFNSTDQNILKYLAIEEFNYELSYRDLYLSFPNIIDQSPSLSFTKSIYVLLKQKFLDKIYILFHFFSFQNVF